MNEEQATAFLAFCDKELRISKAFVGIGSAIRSDVQLQGSGLRDLFDPMAPDKVEQLFNTVISGKIASGKELLIHLEEGSSVMRFFAGAVEDHFIFVGGSTLMEVLAMLDVQVPMVEAELVHYLRALKVRLLLAPNVSALDVAVLDELSRLNNEIVNAGRELSKRNFELFLEREKYQVTIESIGDAVVATDQNLKVTLMNQMAQDLSGWDLKDARGRYVGEVVQFMDEHGNPLDDLFNRSYHEGVNLNLPMNCMLRRRDGSLIPVDDSMAPITDSSGRTLGLVIVYRDITERQRMQKSLMELNEVLRLINKTIRHDILNELTATGGAIDLHRAKSDDHMLDLAERSIVRSIKLIDDMRKLEAALVSGKEQRPYDIKKVITDVLTSFALPSSVEGDATLISADEALPSVLENIVRNAMVHGGTDRVDVLIRKEDRECVVSIADRGRGIPNDIKTSLFNEGFSQGRTGGSGLGLYIVARAMARYGGSVGVRDNVPRGAIFDLRFPLGPITE